MAEEKKFKEINLGNPPVSGFQTAIDGSTIGPQTLNRPGFKRDLKAAPKPTADNPLKPIKPVKEPEGQAPSAAAPQPADPVPPAVNPQEEAQNLAQEIQTDDSFVASSAPVRSEERNTIEEVQRLAPPQPGIDGATAASNEVNRLLDQQSSALEERRKREIEQIERQFAVQEQELKGAQKNEAGTFSSTLQRIGGFLGESASSTGAVLKLNKSHRDEVNALEGAKASAIQAANNAVSNEEFALARERIKEVKDLDETINQRRQEFFKNSLELTNESRREDEFFRDKFKDELETLGSVATSGEAIDMDPQRAAEIDSFYGVPGFTQQYLDVVRNQATADSQKSQFENKTKLLDLLQSIPAGQEVVFPDGTSYTGMGKAGDVATYMQTDDSGNGHLVTHNKVTGDTQTIPVGNIGKTKSSSGSGGSLDGQNKDLVFDNVVAKMSIALEQSKDESGLYDPDIYVEMRQELKDRYPQLLGNIDKLFLNRTNNLFDSESIERLRGQGVFTDDRSFF